MKEAIINFEGLVKNRLGPYWIVIKKNNLYLTGSKMNMSCDWTEDKIRAYHYNYGWRPFTAATNYNANVYLTTSAGDIPLSLKDLRLKDGVL